MKRPSLWINALLCTIPTCAVAMDWFGVSSYGVDNSENSGLSSEMGILLDKDLTGPFVMGTSYQFLNNSDHELEDEVIFKLSSGIVGNITDHWSTTIGPILGVKGIIGNEEVDWDFIIGGGFSFDYLVDEELTLSLSYQYLNNPIKNNYSNGVGIELRWLIGHTIGANKLERANIMSKAPELNHSFQIRTEEINVSFPKIPDENLVPLVNTLTAPALVVDNSSEARLFAENSSILKVNEHLNEIAIFMQNNPDVRLSVKNQNSVGGSDKYNEWLSQRRLGSILRYFEQKGVSSERLKTISISKREDLTLQRIVTFSYLSDGE